ncbi:hypothetical protein FIE12Z_5344 [Fusarium flagelliforme]|uniref:Uncharacterized protein n=1 Tax=Fusarium flagelliforme TaxID=2675880 RepID=A0A395MSH6_9HYPO|nr:hypothetical protein FIE12Z_5344 [Fusarium flagelliforme]
MASARRYVSSDEILRDLGLDRDYTIADPSRPTPPSRRSDPRWKQARARYTMAVWQSFSDRPVPERLYLQAYGQTQRTQLPVREKPREVLEEKLREVLQERPDELVTGQNTVETHPQAPE